MPLPFLAFPTQPLEAHSASPLEALFHRPIAFGPLPLEPLPTRLVGALPLQSLALEPPRDRLAGTVERDYVRVTAAEATRGHRPPARSRIDDAVVTSEPHGAGV